MSVRRKQRLRGERVPEDGVGQLVAAIAAPAEVGDVGEAFGAASGLGRRMSSLTLRLPPLVRSLRPLQWLKNVVVLAALVFSGQLFVVESLARAAAATLIFCCASSAMYLVNDLRDIEGDRVHPKKRHRPIAAGLLSTGLAATTAAVLSGLAVLGAWLVGPPFLAVILTYGALMLAYSYGLKRLVILDVFAGAEEHVITGTGLLGFAKAARRRLRA